MSDTRFSYDAHSQKLLAEMDERNKAFRAEMEDLQKPLRGVILGGVGTGAAIVMMMGALAVFVTHFH
jgi:hypothetical protein